MMIVSHINIALNTYDFTDTRLKRSRFVGYVKGEYQSTLQKIKHYLRRETKVNEKVLSNDETLRYM